jgi:hypothetical protein
MPNYQDAYISDIVVMVDDNPEHPFDSLLAQLKELGLHVENVKQEQGMIEGYVDAGKVAQIDKLPGVEYVRSVFTYVADYPPEDPRDLDKCVRES